MKKISRRQWIGFGIWATLYVLFCIWMENLWLLLGLFVLADIFLTRFVPWGAWKRSKNKHVREALEWVVETACSAVLGLAVGAVVVAVVHLIPKRAAEPAR